MKFLHSIINSIKQMGYSHNVCERGPIVQFITPCSALLTNECIWNCLVRN